MTAAHFAISAFRNSPNCCGELPTISAASLDSRSLTSFDLMALTAPACSVATTGAGVTDLDLAIRNFRTHAAGRQAERRKTRGAYRLRELVSQRFMSHLERAVLAPGEFDAIVERIAARDLDPYSAAQDLLTRALAT